MNSPKTVPWLVTLAGALTPVTGLAQENRSPRSEEAGQEKACCFLNSLRHESR